MVIFSKVAAAVNLYQTSKVVAAVAPPHPPVGPALVALNRLPNVLVHVVPGVSAVAEAQLSLAGGCAFEVNGAIKNMIMANPVERVMVRKIFLISMDS